MFCRTQFDSRIDSRFDSRVGYARSANNSENDLQKYDIVLLLNLLLASCCNVDVINGKLGFLLDFFLITLGGKICNVPYLLFYICFTAMDSFSLLVKNENI